MLTLAVTVFVDDVTTAVLFNVGHGVVAATGVAGLAAGVAEVAVAEGDEEDEAAGRGGGGGGGGGITDEEEEGGGGLPAPVAFSLLDAAFRSPALTAGRCLIDESSSERSLGVEVSGGGGGGSLSSPVKEVLEVSIPAGCKGGVMQSSTRAAGMYEEGANVAASPFRATTMLESVEVGGCSSPLDEGTSVLGCCCCCC